MVRLLAAAVVLCWLVGSALAAGLDAAAVNNAEFRAKPPAEDKIDAAIAAIENIGHSSGWDMLAGIGVTLRVAGSARLSKRNRTV